MNVTDHVEKQDVEDTMSLLWLPYVAIAMMFIVFLGISFLRYHLKHRERYKRKLSEENTKKRLRQKTLKVSSLKSRAKVDASNVSTTPENITSTSPVVINNESYQLCPPSSGENIPPNGQQVKPFPPQTKVRKPGKPESDPKMQTDRNAADGSFRASGEFIFCDSDLNGLTPQQRHSNCWKSENDSNVSNAPAPVWIASEHFEISSMSTSSERLFGGSSNYR